jgi:hypothetical protein
MATAAKFRIDVAIHDLLMNSTQRSPAPAEAKGLTLPEPIFPQFPERLRPPGRCRRSGFQLRAGLVGSAAESAQSIFPAQKNLEHILRKQYVDGYLVFFNINICRNNMEEVRK